MAAADSSAGVTRYGFFHSMALPALMGMLAMVQAYVYPFTSLVVH